MSWHYLPVYVEANGERAYSLCEVYLDDDGLLDSWTASREIAAHGTDPSKLAADLELMARDVRRWEPVAFDALSVGMRFEPVGVAADRKAIPEAVLGKLPRNVMSGRPDETKASTVAAGRSGRGPHRPNRGRTSAEPRATACRCRDRPGPRPVPLRRVDGSLLQVRFFGSRRGTGSAGRPSGRAHVGERQPPGTGPSLDDPSLQARIESAILRSASRSAALVPDPAIVPAPLSSERIVAWLERNGFAYFTDSDGDVGGMWHGRLFYFLVLGDQDEVLQVRGQWQREATIERLGEILEALNEWNADHIWPKAYTRVRDDGAVVVCGETTVDVETGVTDDQLDQLLQCGLATASMLFDALDATFPDPLQVAP